MLDATLLPLRNERAVLRPLDGDDATAFARGTEDPLVRRYAHLPAPSYTPTSTAAMIRGEAREGLQRGDLAVLAIAEPSAGQFAGSLVIFDVTVDTGEIGFWIHPNHRGAGLAAAALDLGGQFAHRCGLRELTARTAVENIASQHILSTAGFVETARAPGAAPSGEVIDLVHYVRRQETQPCWHNL